MSILNLIVGFVIAHQPMPVENPAVIEKAKATVENQDGTQADIQVIKQGSCSFYGVDELLEGRISLLELRKVRVFVVRKFLDFSRLWTSYIDREMYPPVPNFNEKTQCAFFVFMGIQDSSGYNISVESAEEHAPLDTSKMFWVNLKIARPKTPVYGNRKPTFVSPFVVFIVDRKMVENVNDEAITFFIKETTLIKPETVRQQDSK